MHLLLQLSTSVFGIWVYVFSICNSIFWNFEFKMGYSVFCILYFVFRMVQGLSSVVAASHTWPGAVFPISLCLLMQGRPSVSKVVQELCHLPRTITNTSVGKYKHKFKLKYKYQSKCEQGRKRVLSPSANNYFRLLVSNPFQLFCNK